MLEDQEPDAALGNGGLGRLAACFLGFLINTRLSGIWLWNPLQIWYVQAEDRKWLSRLKQPDDWLKDGNPFEMKRPEYAVEVRFGGYVAVRKDEKIGRDQFCTGKLSVCTWQCLMICRLLVIGNHIVNTLRIWDAEAIDTFNLDSFDKGDYQKAVEQQNLARTICEVLYPNDNHMAGKELRLKQQYFFVSASVQRAVTKYMENHDDIHGSSGKSMFPVK